MVYIHKPAGPVVEIDDDTFDLMISTIAFWATSDEYSEVNKKIDEINEKVLKGDA